MLRAFSYVLIAAGLAIAGVGLYLGWTAHKAEQQAEEAWDQMVAARREPRAELELRQQKTRKGPLRKLVHKGQMLARLSIARLGGKWIVLEGAETSVLRKGPGHLTETALPGDNGNCVIAGHRDTQFRMLRNLQVGENIEVEMEGETYQYRVTGWNVVSPSDNRSLYPTASPTLTLVTCYPFYYAGHAPKRFVVHAALIPTAEQLSRLNP